MRCLAIKYSTDAVSINATDQPDGGGLDARQTNERLGGGDVCACCKRMDGVMERRFMMGWHNYYFTRTKRQLPVRFFFQYPLILFYNSVKTRNHKRVHVSLSE